MRYYISILLSLLLFSCVEKKINYYELTTDKNFYNMVVVDKHGVLLPTTRALPDTEKTITEYYIAKEDEILELDGIKHIIHQKGDTLHIPGDILKIHNEDTQFTTLLSIQNNEFILRSDYMLEQCQINAVYKSNCIYNDGLGWFRDRNNIGLDFYKEEDGKYIYKAPFTKWKSGHFDEFDYMFVIYNNSDENSLIKRNEMYFSKEDVSSLFSAFKAYLLLR